MPALYQTEVPASMAKMIMSRHVSTVITLSLHLPLRSSLCQAFVSSLTPCYVTVTPRYAIVNTLEFITNTLVNLDFPETVLEASTCASYQRTTVPKKAALHGVIHGLSHVPFLALLCYQYPPPSYHRRTSSFLRPLQ